MERKHDIIDVFVAIKHETEKAILVTNLKNKDVWLPKSQCEIEYSGDKKNADVQLPEWLATDKELI